MQSLKKPRKKISIAVESQVLIQSRRRCCLCFHFNGDIGMKNGQIAHINRDRDDNEETNLAFLCFEHHDNYDSIRSQSKGITTSELTHAKKTLYETLSEKLAPEPIRITISIDRDFYKLSPNERELILKDVFITAGVHGHYDIHKIAPGSIKFTVQLNSDDAERVLVALNQHMLSKFGVQAVTLETTSKQGISFAKSFKAYNHGVSKRQAIDVLLHPDSALHLDGNRQVGQEQALISLYLKQITEKYSILIIVVKGKVIDCIFPISHSHICFPRGADPLLVLREFLVKYGIELVFDGRRSLLWLSERIFLPLNVRTSADFIRYLGQQAKESGEEFEFCCGVTEGNIISQIANVQIMFAISKQRYYPSLKDLGMNLNYAKLGSFVSHTR